MGPRVRGQVESEPPRFVRVEMEPSGFASSGAMGKAPIGPDVVTGVAVWISFQIILMFALGLPKRTGRFYGRYDFSGPKSRGIDISNRVLRGPFLLVVGIEDR